MLQERLSAWFWTRPPQPSLRRPYQFCPVRVHANIACVIRRVLVFAQPMLEAILLPSPAHADVACREGFVFRHDPTQRQAIAQHEKSMHMIGHQRRSEELK